LFRAPAGPVSGSFRLSDAQSWSDSTSTRPGVTRQVELARNTGGGQATVSVPLTSRRNNFLGGLGDISANGNVALDQVSDFGALKTIGVGANWTPITPFQVRVSYSNEDRA